MENAKIITEIKRLLELGAYNASLIAKESPSAEEDYNAIRQFIDSGALEKLKIEAPQPCTIHAVSESYLKAVKEFGLVLDYEESNGSKYLDILAQQGKIKLCELTKKGDGSFNYR